MISTLLKYFRRLSSPFREATNDWPVFFVIATILISGSVTTYALTQIERPQSARGSQVTVHTHRNPPEDTPESEEEQVDVDGDEG